MPKIKYRNINMNRASLALVEVCNRVIDDYQAQGFTLTLRQLFASVEENWNEIKERYA